LFTDLPQSVDFMEVEFSLEMDQNPSETEVEVAGIMAL
jgi:hypothetical protein